MNEEVLIPKMNRRSAMKRKIKIPMLNFVVILFCTLMIIGSTFININVKHYILPWTIFSSKGLTSSDFIYSFSLIPQIPVVMFVCSTLGRRMAITSVLLYILTGLFIFPVFALGGGFRYIFEYGFGYILGYIPAVAIAGNLLKKYSFPDMIKSTLAGVFIIHVIGILYMILLAILKHAGGGFVTSWISAQSGLKIFYDLVASFVLVLVGKYLNQVLKFIMD
jgi:biotin transporter BioY